MDQKTNNVPLILGSIVVLGVIAIGAFALMQDKGKTAEDTMMKKEEVMVKDEGMMEKKDDAMMEKKDETMMEEKGDTMMKKDEGAMMEKGSYEAYSADKLALAATGDVVLFFRASWCPSCRALDADIKANSIPGGLTILDVNYDTETVLKQKYGVTSQHTLVQVDASGNLIQKWSGSPTLASVVAKVQ